MYGDDARRHRHGHRCVQLCARPDRHQRQSELRPAAGGTSVTITGTNFTGATAVTFGGTAATGVTVVSATSITATTPAHAFR